MFAEDNDKRLGGWGGNRGLWWENNSYPADEIKRKNAKIVSCQFNIAAYIMNCKLIISFWSIGADKTTMVSDRCLL